MSTARTVIAIMFLISSVAPADSAGATPQRGFGTIQRSPLAEAAVMSPDRLQPWFADFPATADVPEGRIYAETRPQVADARWALERFAEAGLKLPSVEFWMHADRVSCGPRKEVPPVAFTMFRDGQALVFSCGPRFALLHELGHVLGATTMSDSDKVAFAAIRDADAWRTDDWVRSADEHFADVVAWGLHPDHVRPSRTMPNDDASLAAAFVMATGVEPLP